MKHSSSMTLVVLVMALAVVLAKSTSAVSAFCPNHPSPHKFHLSSSSSSNDGATESWEERKARLKHERIMQELELQEMIRQQTQELANDHSHDHIPHGRRMGLNRPSKEEIAATTRPTKWSPGSGKKSGMFIKIHPGLLQQQNKLQQQEAPPPINFDQQIEVGVGGDVEQEASNKAKELAAKLMEEQAAKDRGEIPTKPVVPKGTFVIPTSKGNPNIVTPSSATTTATAGRTMQQLHQMTSVPIVEQTANGANGKKVTVQEKLDMWKEREESAMASASNAAKELAAKLMAEQQAKEEGTAN